VLHAALRDLQWRRRRFLIAVVGTALVFAMSLLLSGLEAAFTAETDRWLASTGADGWIVKDDANGPIMSFNPVEVSRVAEVAAAPGVVRADPFVALTNTVIVNGDVRDVNVFGVRPGGLGQPAVRDGRPLEGTGEIVVNDGLGLAVGDTVVIGGADSTVVGLVRGATRNAGTDNVYLPMVDAQARFLGGLPVATQILTEGIPAEPLPGLAVFDRAEARADVMRPLEGAQQSVGVARMLLWIVAACIIASIVYLTSLERTRDFAVFKAVGTRTRDLALGLAVQALILSLAAAVLAVAVSVLLSGLFPIAVEVPASAMLALPVVAVPVGLLASLAGLRRAVRVEPAAAFGGP
jgi:putative ABC transport system permease protein